jgi:uncharacterized protein YodC (DUF2158 family)
MGYRSLLVETNGGEFGVHIPGSMVRLRSGGPKMEVEGKTEEGNIMVVWVGKSGEVHRDSFAPGMLKSASGLWG